MAEVLIAKGAKLHKLSLDSSSYKAIERGQKTFLIVQDTAPFAAGDVIELIEQVLVKTKQGESLRPGETLWLRILLVESGYGVQDGHVALSIRMHFPSIKERESLRKGESVS